MLNLPPIDEDDEADQEEAEKYTLEQWIVGNAHEVRTPPSLPCGACRAAGFGRV